MEPARSRQTAAEIIFFISPPLKFVLWLKIPVSLNIAAEIGMSNRKLLFLSENKTVCHALVGIGRSVQMEDQFFFVNPCQICHSFIFYEKWGLTAGMI